MSAPYPPFGSENVTDDDGQVLDSFFVETDNPPDLRLAQEPIPILPRVTPEYPTKLFTGFQVIFANTDPFRLFQADVRRVDGKIYVASLNATPDLNQYVYVSEQRSAIPPSALSGNVLRARPGKSIDIESHSGELWVMGNPGIAVEGVEITWILTSEQI